MAPFHDLDHAALDQFIGGQLIDATALELDAALGHITALRAQQIGDRLQGRGLARAIGTEQGDDLALGHVQGHALEHQNDMIVDDLDIVDAEISGHG